MFRVGVLRVVSLHALFIFLFFFFNDPAPPEIYPLSLRAALPIEVGGDGQAFEGGVVWGSGGLRGDQGIWGGGVHLWMVCGRGWGGVGGGR